MANEHRTGRVNSGDVSIFYRAFGARGRTPIIVMHGANYYNSYDWIEVAGTLAADREVVAFDRRGWGESSWSPSKDYSLDAHMDDALAVAAQMRWDKCIFMGHSASARVVCGIAAHFPNRTASLIVVDPLMVIGAAGGGGGEGGGGAGGGGGQQRPTTGNAPTIFPSIEAAMASFARLSNPPRVGHDRVRAENALVRVEAGYMLKRDPDSGNIRPIGEGAGLPRRPARDVWADLKDVKAPTMFVRGLRSDRWDNPAILQRLTSDYPKFSIVTVDAQHDVAAQAPAALVAHVKSFAASA